MIPVYSSQHSTQSRFDKPSTRLTTEELVIELALDEGLVIQQALPSLCLCQIALAEPGSPSHFLNILRSFVVVYLAIGHSRLAISCEGGRYSPFFGWWR